MTCLLRVGKISAENVALFDMDGTLCDYNAGLFAELEKLRFPGESVFDGPVRDDAPEYIRRRAELIKSSEDWWANLPEFKLGFDIWNAAGEIGYTRMILTQPPRNNPYSWSGKKRWVDKKFGKDQDLTMTRDKGLVYGRIFVDDYPKYILRWLAWRKRGLVIMPANEENKDFKHEQVIRYDGSNLEEVVKAMNEKFMESPDAL